MCTNWSEQLQRVLDATERASNSSVADDAEITLLRHVRSCSEPKCSVPQCERTKGIVDHFRRCGAQANNPRCVLCASHLGETRRDREVQMYLTLLVDRIHYMTASNREVEAAQMTCDTAWVQLVRCEEKLTEAQKRWGGVATPDPENVAALTEEAFLSMDVDQKQTDVTTALGHFHAQQKRLEDLKPYNKLITKIVRDMGKELRVVCGDDLYLNTQKEKFENRRRTVACFNLFFAFPHTT